MIWDEQLLARPCPACTVDGKPTGRESLPWEQAIIDAMPRPTCEWWDDPEVVYACQCIDCDPVAFASRTITHHVLAVYADKMQADGDELGTLVAAWLRGPDVFGQHVALVQRLAADAVSARGS